jgi:hypothetical protein
MTAGAFHTGPAHGLGEADADRSATYDLVYPPPFVPRIPPPSDALFMRGQALACTPRDRG